jgi:hypothetical protein
MLRASYNNQARVHNGYHYPRSFTTAYRSRANFPLFARDWPEAVESKFTKLYAIARKNSKVTSGQFQRFCREIGAVLRPASRSMHALFDPGLIEAVFVVEEHAFDSRTLAQWATSALTAADVEVLLNRKVTQVRASNGAIPLAVRIEGPDVTACEVRCRYLLNCTYSGINQMGGDYSGTQSRIKHEITEMALIRLPLQLQQLGITVMDGPFFSTMPFPPRQLHTLSHVRFTPHQSWVDARGVDPYDLLTRYDRNSRVERMVRDAGRYVPLVRDAEYVDSLFEVKSVLMRNETDDGRPILFEQVARLPGMYSVLGGKIDNIYDVLEKLDKEPFYV